jgi:hypothetical protein
VLPTEQRIVTSSGREDPGLFGDDGGAGLYRPFEGTGAISRWGLSLPTAFPQFDYRTISDVIIHMRYRARSNGGMVEAASKSIAAQLDAMQHAGGGGVLRLFSVRHDMSDDWLRFRDGPADAGLTMTIRPEFIPYPLRSLARISPAKCFIIWVPRVGPANLNDARPVMISGSQEGPWIATAERQAEMTDLADAYMFAHFDMAT